jgi:cytochrome c-type biogenesis protein
MKTNTERRVFSLIAFSLLAIITASVFYLFKLSTSTVDLAFSYVAGISMIVLPCTLPLAFIIVPLSMGKGYKKGFAMALLFGLGLAITIALYGIFVALIGKSIGLDEAIGAAGVVSKVLFMIGGTAALLFGLSELKLIKLSLPSYLKTPKFIETREDYAKAFFLGLLLGNAGVGCPNPLFYILLGDIAVKGSVGFGALMGIVHGIGRATPLIFLSILGISGYNATSFVVKHRETMTKIIGWSLVFLGAIIFIMGSSHGWYEETVVHEGWNKFVDATGLPNELHGEEHEHEKGKEDFIPGDFAPWVLGGLIIGPILWYKLKRRSKNG